MNEIRHDWTHEIIIKILPQKLVALSTTLITSAETKFNVCTDLIVWDKPGKANRFTLIYLLHSYTFNRKLSFLIQTRDLQPIQSIERVFKSITWSEREAWDMYGIFIVNNKDLRRILTDYGFNGYPLRKDFPLTGFIESTYDDLQKKIEHTKVELTQAYRVFKFPQRWYNDFHSYSSNKE